MTYEVRAMGHALALYLSLLANIQAVQCMLGLRMLRPVQLMNPEGDVRRHPHACSVQSGNSTGRMHCRRWRYEIALVCQPCVILCHRRRCRRWC